MANPAIYEDSTDSADVLSDSSERFEDGIIDVNVLYDNNDQIDNEQGRFVQAEEAQTVIISDVDPGFKLLKSGKSCVTERKFLTIL